MMEALLKLIDEAINVVEERAEAIDNANYELMDLVEMMEYLMN